MARTEESDQESEGGSEERESSSSGEEIEEEGNPSHFGRDEQKGKIAEYEKQRLSRIAENKARMEALGLSKMASSLMGSSPVSRKSKGRRKVADEDEDYRPGGADDNEDGDDDDDGSNDEDDEDEEFLPNTRSTSGKRKAMNKGSRSKKKVPFQKNFNGSDNIQDEDDDLMKAIALSLQDSVGGNSGTNPGKRKQNGEEMGSGKKKKPFMSRLQMTEDELIIYFYQFDEAGKGFITLRDLGKMVMAHDFTWTDDELADMIRCFDSDKDGKLSLDEFRKIVTRCRMLKEYDE